MVKPLENAIQRLSQELGVPQAIPIFDGMTKRVTEYSSDPDVWIPTVAESVSPEDALQLLSQTPDDETTQWRVLLLIGIMVNGIVYRHEEFPGADTLSPISNVLREHKIGLNHYCEFYIDRNRPKHDDWDRWLLDLQDEIR